METKARLCNSQRLREPFWSAPTLPFINLTHSFVMYNYARLTLALLLPAMIAGAQEKQTAATIIINPQHPLRVTEKAQRASILKWSERWQQAGDCKMITAHPSADFFPGNVKPDARQIRKAVHIQHQQIREALVPIVSRLGYSGSWSDNIYSTGLYAPPGKCIEITIPAALADKKINVQIGAHSDNLGVWMAAQEDWRRMPLIVKESRLRQTTTKVASPFGGLIYITASPKSASWDGEIIIDGGVPSLYYEAGKTTDEEWAAQLKDNKAPWGELVTDNVILTLPDSILQQLKQPARVMKMWHTIIGGEMELAQIPQPFYRPQRMVIDEHIGGGFMHSGYPVMIHHSPSVGMVSADVIANPEKLLVPSKGGANWGFFHEIGHNMQNLDWVFGGTTEVSCNFFSLYMFDRLLGGRDNAHTGISNEVTQQKMQNYFSAGANYDTWKEDPFLGLIMFRQLQEAFGWESFKTFFREYQQLAAQFPDGRYASTDEKKRDLWAQQFSRITGRNLVPFFEKWGIPISKEAASAVATLPGWMPYNFPPVNN